MRLYKLLQLKYPTPDEKEEIRNVSEFLKSKELDGWMTIKASN